MRKIPKGRIINPMTFAREFVRAVENDPGTERKAMLFYVDGREVRFVQARSEARVMVIEMTSNLQTIENTAATVKASVKPTRRRINA